MAQPVQLAKSSRFVVLASICIVVAALYFAQVVLIPLALAVLFCFLLAPLVTRLERWGLGRVAGRHRRDGDDAGLGRARWRGS